MAHPAHDIIWFQIWDLDLGLSVPVWQFIGWVHTTRCKVMVLERNFTIYNSDGTLFDSRSCTEPMFNIFKSLFG